MTPARTGKGSTPLRSIRVPTDVWTAAKDEADRRGESLSSAIVRFLTSYAKNRRTIPPSDNQESK